MVIFFYYSKISYNTYKHIFLYSDEAIKDMSHLSNIIYAVCELAGDELYEYDYNDISPWWQYVRELLLECCKSLSVVVAMTCKAIAQKFRRNLKKVFYLNTRE